MRPHLIPGYNVDRIGEATADLAAWVLNGDFAWERRG